MFGRAPVGANAYARVGIETGVAAASPHKLISLLFEGALTAIAGAVHETAKGSGANFEARGNFISKAVRIINEGLRPALDLDAGGDLAQNLNALYGYLATELVLANAENDASRMEAAKALIADIADSWKKIDPGATTPSDQAANEAQLA